MKLNIKQNWSEQFVYDDDSPGFFAGRRRELDSLKSIIKGNNSSSMLISSVRGVGKSSFVHKALKELSSKKNEEYIPVFVNLGNTLGKIDANPPATANDQNKAFIKALIRAAALSPKLKGSTKREIKKVYAESLGVLKKKKRKSETHTESEVEFFGVTVDIKSVAPAIVSSLALIGSLSSEDITYVRLFASIAILGSVFAGSKWYKELKVDLSDSVEQSYDNDFEYLEIKFEKWLSKNRNKKIIFVIDELDKLKSDEALKIIKSFKNLFSRSFAHFLFIGGESIFNSTEGRREGDEEEAAFPTLFTHRIYLPTPSSVELREYFLKIFENKKGWEEVSDYLLFKAENDFFELKRVLFDLIQYDEKGLPFLDTERIEAEDIDYRDIIKLYRFVDHTVTKKLKTLKKFWEENYNLQRDYFRFLNSNLNKPFPGSTLNDNQKDLVGLLVRGSIIRELPLGEDGEPMYEWTGSYRIEAAYSLYPEEEELLEEYSKLIEMAEFLNNLGNGSLLLSKNKGYQVLQGSDGENVTGIPLHDLVQKNKKHIELLKNPDEVSTVRVEDTEKILEKMKSTKQTLEGQYYEVICNTLDIMFKGSSEIFKITTVESHENNIDGVIASIPGLSDVLKGVPFTAYGNTNKSKYVFILKDFTNIEPIKASLETIKNNKNLLFVNVAKGEKYLRTNQKYTEENASKTKSFNRQVSNFNMYQVSSLRDVPKVVKPINKFIL